MSYISHLLADFNDSRVVYRVFRVYKSSGHTSKTIGTQDHVFQAPKVEPEEPEIPYFHISAHHRLLMYVIMHLYIDIFPL